MLVSISRFSRSRWPGGASSIIDTAIFMRASGERSSWLALASSDWCARTSASMRAAAALKLDATAATSSRPLTSTRWSRRPLPKISMPRLSDCRRRVRWRTTGQAPAATATNRMTSTSTRPTPRCHEGGRNGSGGSSGGGPAPAPSPRAPACRNPPGRMTHNVRPSSRRIASPRPRPSFWRRWNESDAPMRSPLGASSASGRRNRCDQSRSAAAWSAGGASVPGSERWISSPQAAMRSDITDSARVRSCSRWRCTTQPEAKANSASTATTVR